MTKVTRCAAAVAAAASLALGLVACGGGASDGGLRIGLLLPDTQIARWEGFDRPLIEQRIEELCGDCTVEAVNAHNDVTVQQQQVDTLITKGVDAMILAPIDAQGIQSTVERADDAGIPVVAYDRLVEGPISGYSSFDGVQVGRLQGEGLLEGLDRQGRGERIVMMNGSPTDPNAGLFKRGALSVLEGRVTIEKQYDTLGWNPRVAYTNMSGAIADLGADEIDGVLSANDAMASSVIAALKAARVDPLPPVTGQDAELSAVQRILDGEQYMTVYKPYEPEAFAAAEMAVALGRGRSLAGIADDTVSNDTVQDVPAALATPISVTVDNIDDTIVRDGLYTVDQICIPRLEPACERAGLT
jgi:D-xylose transport system substrate-binding protein